jgi:hypothetical protein
MGQGNRMTRLEKTARYSSRVKKRKEATSNIKGRGKPLGGAPPIPEGKMSPAAALPQPEFGFDDESEPTQESQPALHPSQQTPGVPGVGSAYPVNQDVTRGETDGPVSLKQAREMGRQTQGSPSSLSRESLQAMEHIKGEIDSNSGIQSDDLPSSEIDESKQLDDVEKDMATGTNFDFGALADARQKLLSEERRKEVEERLEPLDIGDLISQKGIQQNIPVLPGKLEVLLRTYSQREYLWCLQYVYEHPGSSFYIEELLNTCKLCCSVVALNGKILPEHRNNIGLRNEEVGREDFEKKLTVLLGFPVQLLADLSVQNIWFNDRVNDLFSIDNLKNG